MFPPRGPIRAGEKRALQLELSHHAGRAPVRARRRLIAASSRLSRAPRGAQAFYLGAEDAEKLKGKRVLIVDDVVSTGGSIKAIRNLMQQAGAVDAGVLCAFTEGGSRDDVRCLGNLPVNAPEWK